MKDKTRQTVIKVWHHQNPPFRPLSDQEVGQQDFEGLLWGQRIYDPDPLYIKAQGLDRGEILPRTNNESPKRPKDMAEDDLVLGIP